jgi:tRNA-specific 2-thiouridylase
MKVLLAMSGGVDSSAAAVVLRDDGHDVVGVTMRLWGGESDTGCCSVSDVDDARRVAQQVGIDHLVFNFSDDFDAHVVGPYVDAHVNGTTPNPCIECNRHLKFDRLIRRGRELGFDAVATGHHARIAPDGGSLRVTRGADRAKDQSYVVHMLSGADLGYVMFPVGGMQKSEVRELAARAGLRTAAKPDSQDVCFIGSTAGRGGFLGSRMDLHPADVVDASGRKLGTVDAVELVTLGQRRGLGLGGGDKRYVIDVSVAERRVTVGDEEMLHSQGVTLGNLSWPHAGDATAVQGATVLVQGSAHGERHEAVVEVPGDRSTGTQVTGSNVRLVWSRPQRRISPGQTVVLYDPTDTFVLGGGIVTDPR